MVSLPVAIQLRPVGVSFNQPATGGTQKAAQDAFRFEPASSRAPEWNNDSFRPFSEVLTSRLKYATTNPPSDATPSSSAGAKSLGDAKSANPAAMFSPTTQVPAPAPVQYKPGITQLQIILPQVALNSASQEESAQEMSSSSLAASENSEMPLSIAKQRSSANADVPAAPSHLKPATPNGPEYQPSIAFEKQNDRPAAPVNNIAAATNIQSEPEEPATVQRTSTGAAQLQHASTSQVAPLRAQEETGNAQPLTYSRNADAEVFQIELHPAPELAQNRNSDAAGQITQNSENLHALTTGNAAVQTLNSTQVASRNIAGEGAAASKRAPDNTGLDAKNPAQAGSASGTPTLGTGNTAAMSAAGISAPSTGSQGQISIVSPRSLNSSSAPGTSSRPAETAASTEETRPVIPNQVIVRMEGVSGQVVNVRFLNQGDQVQVAVRSNDPSTTAQLRQNLNSLSDDLNRIGWKADPSALSAHGISTLHDASRLDTDSQANNKGSALDWDGETPNKKSPVRELWEEFKDLQED